MQNWHNTVRDFFQDLRFMSLKTLWKMIMDQLSNIISGLGLVLYVGNDISHCLLHYNFSYLKIVLFERIITLILRASFFPFFLNSLWLLEKVIFLIQINQTSLQGLVSGVKSGLPLFGTDWRPWSYVWHE